MYKYICKVYQRILKVINGLWRDIHKWYIIIPKNLKPIEDSSDDWFYKSKIIPHAMGNINGFSYTNSKEALEQSLNGGYKTIEIDVSKTLDGRFVLAHNLTKDIIYEDFISSKIFNQFTPLSLQDLIVEMRKNDFLYVLLDSKDCIYDVCVWLKDNAFDVIDRFIVQIGRVKEYKKISKIYNFKYFHWNFSIDGNLNQHLAFVVKNNIYTCSVSPKKLTRKKMKYLFKYNVKPYAYTINSAEAYDVLKEEGIWGIISDSL